MTTATKNSNARPVIYDRSRVRIGWWNVAGRSDTCACCGRQIKKSCNLRLTDEGGDSVWAEFGVVCAARIIAKHSRSFVDAPIVRAAPTEQEIDAAWDARIKGQM